MVRGITVSKNDIIDPNLSVIIKLLDNESKAQITRTAEIIKIKNRIAIQVFLEEFD